MEFPESVLTKARSGKIEVRGLESRGKYVMCKYLDPKTLKPTDLKKKLCLMDEEGNVQEFFIIPTKTPNRYLLIKSEKEEKERKVWNEKTGTVEELWK